MNTKLTVQAKMKTSTQIVKKKTKNHRHSDSRIQRKKYALFHDL